MIRPVLRMPRTASFAGALGASPRASAARRTAAAPSRAPAGTSSVSGWFLPPGRFPRGGAWDGGTPSSERRAEEEAERRRSPQRRRPEGSWKIQDSGLKQDSAGWCGTQRRKEGCCAGWIPWIGRGRWDWVQTGCQEDRMPRLWVAMAHAVDPCLAGWGHPAFRGRLCRGSCTTVTPHCIRRNAARAGGRERRLQGVGLRWISSVTRLPATLRVVSPFLGIPAAMGGSRI